MKTDRTLNITYIRKKVFENNDTGSEEASDDDKITEKTQKDTKGKKIVEAKQYSKQKLKTRIRKRVKSYTYE